MNKLKPLRLESNESQENVGKLICVSWQAVGQYELEKRELSQDKIIILAEYYSCSTNYFLGKSNIRNPEKATNEYKFAYHKETEDLTDEEISDALRFYKEMKNRMNNKKEK